MYNSHIRKNHKLNNCEQFFNFVSTKHICYVLLFFSYFQNPEKMFPDINQAFIHFTINLNKIKKHNIKFVRNERTRDELIKKRQAQSSVIKRFLLFENFLPSFLYLWLLPFEEIREIRISGKKQGLKFDNFFIKLVWMVITRKKMNLKLALLLKEACKSLFSTSCMKPITKPNTN
ncbi:hypothetical protein BpHYR1_031678 [Brachionus plicatilis]|uniref:Uncharacterized protein n=1 Tax=Brachionus plicatilis TaxID=10195 RepID=A0A3M7PSV3_BRAPC|nr:hypothetical protein BpHYR1_031678 [Brachionus plicatilis]